MGSFVKDISSMGLSKLAIILFGILTSSILARWLGPEKVGTMAALMVYPSIFLAFGSLGVRQSLTYYTGKKIFSEKRLMSSVFHLWIISSTICCFICYLLLRYFSNSGDDSLLVLLVLLPIPFNLYVSYLSGIYLGKNDIKTFNSINWIPPLLILVGTVILVVGLTYGLTGALFSYAVGPIGLFVVFIYKTFRKNEISFKLDLIVIKALVSLGIIYAFALLINVLNYSLDVVLLDKLSTQYEVGIYSRGAGLAQYLWHIPMILGTIVFARSSIAKDGASYSLKVVQLMRLSIVSVGILSVVLFLISPTVIHVLFGSEFHDSNSIVRILLPAVIMLTVFKVLNMDLAGKGKPWVAVKAMGPALIANVIFNILFIPSHGSVGAAYASLISYIFATVLFIVFYSKETSISPADILSFKRSDFNVVKSLLNKFLK